jgi:hypothetical protein
MALELIKGERAIRALKRGAKRLNDGGGLYLLPFAGGDSHYWRLDYTHEGRRKTLSLGVHPEVDLLMAREKAAKTRATLANGQNPSQERRQVRSAKAASIQAEKRAKAGLAPEGSFEAVARRWFAVKKDQWVENYSSKVIRRIELHGLPCFGRKPLETITPKMILDACRAVEANDTLETAVTDCASTARRCSGSRLQKAPTCVTRARIFVTLSSARQCGILQPSQNPMNWLIC